MYINLMNDQNKNYFISYWLLLITALVALMIVVGGITRLTDSGLSITKWDLFIGIIPPLSLDSWESSFQLYKQIPEYRLLNFDMTLNEFKTIFWWEYIHRLLGRIIGLFFLLPLIYLTIQKKINLKNIISFYSIFLLICLQGFIGWYMVQSGLTEKTDVSHYRLSVHLTLAFIIFIFLFLKYLEFSNNAYLSKGKKLPFNLPIVFVFFLLLQIAIGAFVSGLDAGQIYQSWPLMNQSYFPDDSTVSDLLALKSFQTPSLVQFLHRNIAYLIFIFFIAIMYIIFRNDDYNYLRTTAFIIFLSLFFQIFLGVLTILSGAQILLASLHQIGSIILISTSLILVVKSSTTN